MWSRSETGGVRTGRSVCRVMGCSCSGQKAWTFVDVFEGRQNPVGARVDADGRQEAPAHDAVTVDDEQRPLRRALAGAEGSVGAGDGAARLEVREQREAELAAFGE